jgi:hypothetical protein
VFRVMELAVRKQRRSRESDSERLHINYCLVLGVLYTGAFMHKLRTARESESTNRSSFRPILFPGFVQSLLVRRLSSSQVIPTRLARACHLLGCGR